MKTKILYFSTFIIVLIFFYSCFNIDENSKEYKDKLEKVQKEYDSDSNQEDTNITNKTKTDVSIIFGKWREIWIKNTEIGSFDKVNIDPNNPDASFIEFKKDGGCYYTTVDKQKLCEKFVINNDKITYTALNGKIRNEKIMKLSKHELTVYVYEYPNIQYSYEKVK